MAKKLCPICDKPLIGGCYCKDCKKVIKNPIILKSDVYLNERHPRGENDCDFHGSYGEVEDTVPQTAPAELLRQKLSSVTVSNMVGEKSGRRGNQGFGVFLVPVMTVLVLAALSRQFTGNSNLSYSDHGVAEAVIEASPQNYDYTELSEEEVIATGAKCNSLGHFSIKGKDVEPYLREKILSCGYVLADEWEDSYNYSMTEDGQTLYGFNHTYTMTLAPENGEKADNTLYIELSADTATDEIHSLSGWVLKKTDVTGLMEEFVGLIEQAEGVQPADSRILEICSQLESYDGQESFYWEGDSYYIYCAISEGDYYFSIESYVSHAVSEMR